MDSSNARSISGRHIPFNKDSHNDAFQDMTAFSPPSAPENWLNRYSSNHRGDIKEETTSSKNKNSTSKLVKKEKFSVPKANQLEDPCKKYIDSAEISVKSNKSLGTDDHFKSAVCSKNLLKVCEKLMTKKETKSSARFEDAKVINEDDFDAELSLMNEKSRMEFYRDKHGRNRRDSQSLPASPKMERKKSVAVVSHNPYFTITKPEVRQESNISFLTNLFGITAVKNPSKSQISLAQKYDVADSYKNHDISESSISAVGSDQQPSIRQMTPKPHPYREMNIFSPTSM